MKSNSTLLLSLALSLAALTTATPLPKQGLVTNLNKRSEPSSGHTRSSSSSSSSSASSSDGELRDPTFIPDAGTDSDGSSRSNSPVNRGGNNNNQQQQSEGSGRTNSGLSYTDPRTSQNPNQGSQQSQQSSNQASTVRDSRGDTVDSASFQMTDHNGGGGGSTQATSEEDDGLTDADADGSTVTITGSQGSQA
ncbi:hypothetical protein QBC41DRAFT_300027 [Cercophora samala]|uniref:Uncharacterized protein n=1 Tax=Cercophora samala TaxID=330535 RepID=A0AA39ZJ72_9PEZI|nr:hypothetical protein QBC41DRAFT_300027 [Cercophora samala]